jgi:DNA-directed RNA polymerase specialized sigma24 family protein
MSRVHGELRRLAACYLRRERGGHTRQARAVVHEGYLRLLPQRPVHWENRGHFFGIAARMMRRVLVDHAPRYFAGLTVEEIAEVMGISPATVKREWTLARLWLRRRLQGK